MRLRSLMLLLACASPALGQGAGALSGTVTNGGAPLSQALVVLDSIRETRTDSAGAFRFVDVLAGDHRIRVTSIGMSPIDHDVTIHAGREARLAIQMDKITVLDSVRVTATDRLRLGREFNDRRILGLGAFMDSAGARRYPRVAAALQDMQGVHSKNGKLLLGPLPGCVPNYWIDGVNWGQEEDMLKFVEPGDVVGIEAYERNVPERFYSRRTKCAVLIWTRRSWP